MANNVKATARTLDMTDVKDSGGNSFNKKRLPEGDYRARVIKVEDAPVKSGDDKGTAQWLFTIQPIEHPSRKFPYYCKLVPNQLWKIRNMMVAAGMNVPKKKIKIDPERLVGKVIAISLEDDEYDGKPQSNIGAIFPTSELEDSVADDDENDAPDDEGDDDEDEAAPIAASSDEDDEDEEEGDDEEEGGLTWADIADLNRAGLKKVNADNEFGIKVLKSMSDDHLRAAIAKHANITVPADDDDEEEEEEEPAPKPVAKKKKRRKAEVTDDELEELDIDDV